MNQDVLRVVFSKLNPVHQLSCYHVFDEKPPSQFLVSKELLSRNDIKGINGLVQLAMSTGDYEPCVRAALHYIHTRGLYSTAYESQLRAEYIDYDSQQRVTRLDYFIRYPSFFFQ
jgi:hypothetical protein